MTSEDLSTTKDFAATDGRTRNDHGDDPSISDDTSTITVVHSNVRLSTKEQHQVNQSTMEEQKENNNNENGEMEALLRQADPRLLNLILNNPDQLRQAAVRLAGEMEARLRELPPRLSGYLRNCLNSRSMDQVAQELGQAFAALQAAGTLAGTETENVEVVPRPGASVQPAGTHLRRENVRTPLKQDSTTTEETFQPFFSEQVEHNSRSTTEDDRAPLLALIPRPSNESDSSEANTLISTDTATLGSAPPVDVPTNDETSAGATDDNTNEENGTGTKNGSI